MCASALAMRTVAGGWRGARWSVLWQAIFKEPGFDLSLSFDGDGPAVDAVEAIMDRVVGADMLPTLISKAPLLYQEVSSGVRTNLSLEQMISLAWLALKIPSDQIQTGVISPPNMVGFHTRPDGAQVLRFIPDQIRELRNRLFVDTSALGPDVYVRPEEGITP